ncbi:MAG: serine hydrolase [bacterium]
MPLIKKALRRRGFAKFLARASLLLFFPVPIRAAPVLHPPCFANDALPIVAATDSTGPMLTPWLQKLSDSLHADVGVAYRDLHTGRKFFFNEKMMMHAASTMKVPVMIEVFRQAQAGKFRLEDSLLVKNEFASIVDGSLYALDLGDDSDELLYQAIGRKATIHSLVEAMITVSSNLATNMLIELVAAPNIMNTLAQLGVHNMKVLRGVEDGKAFERGLNNRTDAHDLMLTLEALAQNRAASPASCREMIEILKRQKFRECIPAGLPPGVVAGNKTGSITAIDHDAAIIFPPGRQPCLMVVLTRGMPDHERAHDTIAHIARRLYEDLILRHD